MQAGYILLISSILFISCKKNQQSIRSANQQSSNDIKLDTTFRFSVKEVSFFDPIDRVGKDFYIPALDSIVDPDLKVYRTLYSSGLSTWREIFPFSQATEDAFYARNKGHITYSESIRVHGSINISVRIVARW